MALQERTIVINGFEYTVQVDEAEAAAIDKEAAAAVDSGEVAKLKAAISTKQVVPPNK